MNELRQSGDPRVQGDGEYFETPPLAALPSTNRDEEQTSPEDLCRGVN